VEARVRAPGGGYGPVQTLGSAGASLPAVAVAADGTALAAWAQGPGVAFAVRPPGGSFGAAQLLAADSGSGDVTELRVAMTSGGDALIAYVRTRPFAAVRPAGGAPEAPVALSTIGGCELAATLGRGGQAAVAWRDCGGSSGPIHVARRAPGAAFATSDLAGGDNPSVAVDDTGATVAAWETSTEIRSSAAVPGGAFSTPARISGSNEVATTPVLTAVADGIWAAWRATAAGHVVAARRPNGGAFGAGAVVSPDGVDAAPPALAGADDGSVVIGWIRQADGNYRIEAARRAAGATGFGASGLASSSGSQTTRLSLAGDSDGNVQAAYLRNGIAEEQTLDAAGPHLSNVVVREAGYALDSYPFSVEAADAWSAVAGTSFDFGDGTAAPGPQASHAFAAEGPHTVTVSGTDTLGNVSHVTRPFTVAPPLDRTAPVISGAKLDAPRFKRTGKETAVVAKVAHGTRFRYTLSEPAQVSIFFERVLGGRKRGRSCQRGLHKGRHCRYYEPKGLITRAHPIGGPVSVGFSGRIVGRNGPLKVVDVRLVPGRYRATIIAADANRNISKPVELAFTILR
jgi:hypothetical protein